MGGPRVASWSRLRSQEQHRSNTKALGSEKEERVKEEKRKEGFGEVGDKEIRVLGIPIYFCV